MTDSEVIRIVKEAIQQDVTYINYFVILLKPGRLTDENRNALEYIIDAFKLDDNERKKHVLFLLSHCESSSDALRETYETECLADRTIRRILVVENNEIKNHDCIGLPQKQDVNEWMYEGVMRWMFVQRGALMEYLSKPIQAIQPVENGIFHRLCTIL